MYFLRKSFYTNQPYMPWLPSWLSIPHNRYLPYNEPPNDHSSKVLLWLLPYLVFSQVGIELTMFVLIGTDWIVINPTTIRSRARRPLNLLWNHWVIYCPLEPTLVGIFIGWPSRMFMLFCWSEEVHTRNKRPKGVFFSETTGPIETTVDRSVHWMVFWKV